MSTSLTRVLRWISTKQMIWHKNSLKYPNLPSQEKIVLDLQQVWPLVLGWCQRQEALSLPDLKDRKP